VKPSNLSIDSNGLNYNSFGMLLVGRSWKAGSGYRYGFNGKESDDEVSGNGNQYDYGFRIYNPRLGKFLSVDPLLRKFPELTPFQFASNSPISGVDLDGLEYFYAADGSFLGKTGTSQEVRVVNNDDVSNEVAIQGIKNYNEGKISDKEWNKKINSDTKSLNVEHDEFKRLAGVLYAEGSSTWREAAGILSVLENRSTLNNSTVSEEATTAKGVEGAGSSTVNKINSINANKDQVQNAYKGLVQGLSSNEDFSNGGFWWDGCDFNSVNECWEGGSTGGNAERYKLGYDFTNDDHDLWGQGDNKKPGSTKYGGWDYKYESTNAEGNTTFTKVTEKWKDAQYYGDKKADDLGR